MKKLFASIVAVLALAPVVVHAAYTKGDYINFAGNDSEWNLFQSNQDEYLLTTGNGTIFIEESGLTDGEGHKYLRVIDLFAFSSTGYIGASTDAMDAANSMFTAELKPLIVADVTKPYAYGTGSSVDVDMATWTDIKSLFGVTDVGQTVELTGDMKTFFSEIFTSTSGNLIYVGTKTDVVGDTSKVYGLKVVKNANGIESITSAAIPKQGGETGAKYTLFPVLLMNEAYVCSAGTTDTYSCYECPTTGDQTEYVWKKDGSQDAACKKIDTITTKPKCVKNSKTGVDNYLVPAAIILGVCAIVLTVVKRKDAFKAI